MPAFAWRGGCLAGNQQYFAAEAAAITSSEYLPLADGNSETCNVDGAHILTLNVVRGVTLIIMPRR